jgi:hypothetical protein
MYERDETKKTDAGEQSSVADVLVQMTEQNRAAARELAELAHRFETETADARQREAELMARLGEVEAELGLLPVSWTPG